VGVVKIKVAKKKCSGCHLCEMVCSLFHTGAINVEKSAVRIQKNDLDNSYSTPIVCLQCKEMKCLEDGIQERTEKKKFIWHKSRAKRCPFGALGVFENAAYHCDLCGGNPQCITVCTPGALRSQR
jgi:Fe-S-cluster-containing hydrogenase component 2